MWYRCWLGGRILWYTPETVTPFTGEHPEDPSDPLPGVQDAPEVQGDPVQEVRRVQDGAGQAEVRQEAAGVRRTVEAHPQEKGEGGGGRRRE